MIIHSSENATMLYVDTKDLLYVTLVGFTDDVEVEAAALSLEKKYSKINAKLLLADTSKLATLRQNDFNIIVNKIFPLLRNIGIEKAALLNADNSFGQINLTKLISHCIQTEVKTFPEMYSAEKWLFNN